jgi:hypothetical protein
MGLIRGSLHILSSGAVSAKSKKQRMAAMQLAALQGRTEAEIRAAGGRSFTAVNNDKMQRVSTRQMPRLDRMPTPPPSPRWPQAGSYDATLHAGRYVATIQIGAPSAELLPGQFDDQQAAMQACENHRKWRDGQWETDGDLIVGRCDYPDDPQTAVTFTVYPI